MNKEISYAGQESWLFPGTVRNNILFGEPYVKEKYEQVVKACALNRDFELLLHGDKTYIGDRGASLSGGQCARVNLARFHYFFHSFIPETFSVLFHLSIIFFFCLFVCSEPSIEMPESIYWTIRCQQSIRTWENIYSTNVSTDT